MGINFIFIFPVKSGCVGVWSAYQGLTSLKETDCPSSISSQMPTTSHLASGGILCPSISMLVLYLTRACAGLVCVLTITVSWDMHLFCCFWKTLFLRYYQPPLALIVILPPLPQGSLNLETRGAVQISHLKLSTPQSYSLHVGQLEVSVLIAIYWRERPFWWWIRDSYSNNSLRVILILCLFSGIITFISPLEPITYLVTVSWPLH